MDALRHYREVWLVDFEFYAPAGERPQPICMVAHELRSGRRLRVWGDELALMPVPPWSQASDVLVVAYYASAEMGCCLALGWSLPLRVLDLFVEFRVLTNGRTTPCGSGLLGALSWFGLDALDAIEKDTMRALALRGGPYTSEEREALWSYCESDVEALCRLLPAMAPTLDVPRALLRGRYMGAAARMEWAGVPIDVPVFRKLMSRWETIRRHLVTAVDTSYGVYPDGSFSAERFRGWLAQNDIPWPLLDSGMLV